MQQHCLPEPGRHRSPPRRSSGERSGSARSSPTATTCGGPNSAPRRPAGPPLVRWRAGATTEVTPPGANVRTSVHEYGGGAWWVDRGVAYYVEFDDQRLRRIEPGGEPSVLTPEPEPPRALRYADGRVTPDGEWYVCVRERHGAPGGDRREAVNELVGRRDRRIARTTRTVVTLASGADFYASPRMSPDGRRVVWIQWMHPNMPWDIDRTLDRRRRRCVGLEPRRLAGNGDEALPGAVVGLRRHTHRRTDRTDWWNLYTVDLGTGDLTHAAGGAYDIVEPHWVFGGSRVTSTACTSSASRPATGSARRGRRAVHDDHVAASLRATASCSSVRRSRRSRRSFGSSATRSRCCRPARDLGLDDAVLARTRVHHVPDDRRRDGARAVLRAGAPRVRAAGRGASAAASCSSTAAPRRRPPRRLARRPAVLDEPRLRRRRRRLPGEHRLRPRGTAICCAATGAGPTSTTPWRPPGTSPTVATSTVTACVIRGGSAGGTTTLLALAHHDVFAAGTNLFGVADLVALLSDDHKFESQYIGVARGAVAGGCRRRMPSDHPSTTSTRSRRRCSCCRAPIDTVVPPAHSEQIVEAMQRNGVPVGIDRVRGRGPRLPARREHRAGDRGRTLVLRARARLRTGRRDRTGHDPVAGQPRRSSSACSADAMSDRVLGLESAEVRDRDPAPLDRAAVGVVGQVDRRRPT